MRDLAAYLRRIGVSGTPDLRAVHRGHVTTIPFENLDPRRGRPVSLAPEDLEAKLVTARRGGYCFEHNLLLAAALRELGATVELFLARVRFRAPPGAVRPRSHLVLRVSDGDGVWHADVGFGNGTLLEPIPFGPGDEHVQAGWGFRVVTDGSELVLQTRGEEWVDVYAFAPDPVALVDVEVANWYTATHPASAFVTGLIVAANDSAGGRLILSDWSGRLLLIEVTPTGSQAHEVGWPEVPALLARRFALPGFILGEGNRLELP